MQYAADELEAARSLEEGPLRQGEVRPPAQKPRTFKYVDGIERLSEMKLSFLVDLSTINVYCECKFYAKETIMSGKCCKHIRGQLRRAVYFSTLM